MTPRRRPAARLALFVAPLAAAGCVPAAVTEEGRAITGLYEVFVAIAAVVAVIVLGLTVFAIVRYRRRGPDDDALPPQVHGNVRAEVVWTGIPILIIVALLVLTVAVIGTVDKGVNAADGVDLRVTAFRWGWRFEYPASGVRVEGVREPGPEVVVPVGRTVRVTLAAEDVIHSFYVPQFLFKRDAIPGRENVFAFTVDEAGTYRGQCAEFCGAFHSRMQFTVRAVPPEEFEAWLAATAGAGGASPSAVAP